MGKKRKRKQKTLFDLLLILIFWPVFLTAIVIKAIIIIVKETSKTKSIKRKEIYKVKETNLNTEELGNIGEEKIKYVLNLFLQENAGYVINDYRGCINGKTFQIDHILITTNEILCIETKNYNGKIYGSYDNIEWTIVYNPNDKEKMYNPIRQNKNHIKFLKNILGENTPIKNIVIFVGNANIEEIKEFKEIYTQFEFTNYLFNLNDNINPNFQYWYETLQTYKLNITNEEHIQNIKKFIYN